MVGPQSPNHLERAQTDEALAAAYRVALVLTIAVSGLRAATEAAAGTLQPWIYVPTLVVVAGWFALSHGAGLRTTPSLAAGYAAAMVWLTMLPAARSEAVLVPLFMALALIAGAGGLRWLWRWLTTESEADPSEAPQAWIEDDERPF